MEFKVYTKDNFVTVILEKFPEFQKRWDDHLDFWEGEPAGVCNEMSTFSHFVIALIKNGKTEDLKNIFDLIEDFMINGDSDIKNAAATCFLENLMNVTGEKISAKSFIHLLGKESREYCKAWDEFTGVKTEGL
jgi:hypothetical protein